VEFYDGAFDASNPRKGGKFELGSGHHDVTDEMAAYKLADAPFPGHFRHFLQIQPNKPTKNKLEADINAGMKSPPKWRGKKDWEILQGHFSTG
jgi:2-oxoglutarate ferredoxin oxidoreductase subunit beta